MPKYVYFCKQCEEIFEVKHSLQKTYTICKLCNVEGGLERRPSSIFISKKTSDLGTKTKPGEVVVATIEESKRELQEEQHRLKNRSLKDVK